MMMIQEGEVYNIKIPTYYIESQAELSNIPANVPAGTIVELNSPTGFKVFMKNSAGVFNEL